MPSEMKVEDNMEIQRLIIIHMCLITCTSSQLSFLLNPKANFFHNFLCRSSKDNWVFHWQISLFKVVIHQRCVIFKQYRWRRDFTFVKFGRHIHTIFIYVRQKHKQLIHPYRLIFFFSGFSIHKQCYFFLFLLRKEIALFLSEDRRDATALFLLWFELGWDWSNRPVGWT